MCYYIDNKTSLLCICQLYDFLFSLFCVYAVKAKIEHQINVGYKLMKFCRRYMSIHRLQRVYAFCDWRDDTEDAILYSCIYEIRTFTENK